MIGLKISRHPSDQSDARLHIPASPAVTLVSRALGTLPFHSELSFVSCGFFFFVLNGCGYQFVLVFSRSIEIHPLHRVFFVVFLVSNL